MIIFKNKNTLNGQNNFEKKLLQVKHPQISSQHLKLHFLHMIFTTVTVFVGLGFFDINCMNPWKQGSGFQVTAASWKRNTMMNTARCEGNCLQNFIHFSAACHLLEVPVGACYPSGTRYYIYSLLTKACSLSCRHTTSMNFVEQT